MHHTISYHMAQARITNLRHHAQLDSLARAASRLGRRPRSLRRTRRMAGPAQVATRSLSRCPGIGPKRIKSNGTAGATRRSR